MSKMSKVSKRSKRGGELVMISYNERWLWYHEKFY